MKIRNALSFCAALAVLVASQTLMAADSTPGQVDFGKFSAPASGGEYVEVNISSALISMASRLVEKEEPEVAEILKKVISVKVHVVGLDSKNRSEMMQRAKDVVSKLSDQGWEKIVTAQKKNEDVNIFMKMADDQSVQGVALVVVEGEKQAVFINVAGDIKPEHLSMLGERFHVEQLKKTGAAANKAEKEQEN